MRLAFEQIQQVRICAIGMSSALSIAAILF